MNLFPLLVLAGSDTEVQFNDGGLFGSDSTFTFNKTTDTLVAGGMTVAPSTFVFQPTADSTTAFQVLDADGGTPVLNVDTTNERVGIGLPNPPTKLAVVGTIRASALAANYVDIVDGRIETGRADGLYIQYFPARDVNIRNGALVVKSGGNVGIGTTSPDSTLNIEKGTPTGADAIIVAQDVLIIDSNSGVANFINMRSPSADGGTQGILFTDGTRGQGSIQYSHEAGRDNMLFRTNATTQMTIDSSGNVGIGTEGPLTLMELEGAVPYFTTTCSTHADTAGSGASRWIGRRQDSDGNEYDSGQIEWSHDLTVKDQLAKMVLSVNTGTGLARAFVIDSSTNWTINKTSGVGIKVDLTTPTFGWRDLKGKITNSKGATKPSEITYREGITQFQFGAGDDAGLEYHIPHDYVPGTDIHLHVHWSHISGAVTGGNVIFTYEITYCKGHNQAAFPATVTGTITGTASATQYKHIISEGQISISTGSGTQIDTDDLEPDGLILCRIEMTTNNMTGATPSPFIHEVDVHYQSTNLGTKQKAPDFYT